MRLRSKGQSMLEYTIVITAIVAALLGAKAIIAPVDNSKGLGNIIGSAMSNMTTQSNKIATIVTGS